MATTNGLVQELLAVSDAGGTKGLTLRTVVLFVQRQLKEQHKSPSASTLFRSCHGCVPKFYVYTP